MELFRLFTIIILGGGKSVTAEKKFIASGSEHKNNGIWDSATVRPGSVEEFSYYSNQNSILLNWKQPSELKNKIVRYRIKYKNLGKRTNFCQNASSLEFEKTADSSSYKIEGLEPFSKFMVTITSEVKENEDFKVYIRENRTVYTSGYDQLRRQEHEGVSIEKLNSNNEYITFEIRHIDCTKIVGNISITIKIYCEDPHCMTNEYHHHTETLNNSIITYDAHLKARTNYNYTAWLCKNECAIISSRKFRSDSTSGSEHKNHGIATVRPGANKTFGYTSYQGSISLNWKQPTEFKNKIPQYRIKYKNLGKKPNFCRNASSHEFNSTTYSTSYKIEGLEPFSKYMVTITTELMDNKDYKGNILRNGTLYTSGIGNLIHEEYEGASIKKFYTNNGFITFEIDHIDCTKIVGDIFIVIKIYCEVPQCERKGHHHHNETLNNLIFSYNAYLKENTNYNYTAWLCRDRCETISTMKFRTYSSTELPKPHSIFAEWRANNTFELFWKWNFSNTFNLTGFKILIIERDIWNGTFDYIIDSHHFSTSYIFPISRVFEPASLVVVDITTIDNIYEIEPAKFKTSSYPPFPFWMNENISLQSDTSTITLKLKILRNRMFLSSSFVFILIRVKKTNQKDRMNVKKLEDILNTTFYEINKTRIVGSINLSENNITTLYYQIGNSTSTKRFKGSKLHNLSQIEINNAQLKNNYCYNVTILPVNEFHGKYTYKKFFFDKMTKKSFTRKMDDSKNTMAWWIAVVLFVCIAVVLFLLYRNKIMSLTKTIIEIPVSENSRASNTYNYTYNERTMDTSIKFATNEYEEIQENELQKFIMNGMIFEDVEVKNYEEYVKRSIKNGEFQKQHTMFTKGLSHPCETGKNTENRLKNRYNNLIAYDHSRVKLVMELENGCSDYINANYINDNNEQKAYIATQGPLPQTIADFWRMIWQERVKLIVMLANIYEDGKKRVEQYWPDENEKKIFGNICIRYRSVESFADYEYRIFSVTCEGEIRQVFQIHFTSWPGHGIPLYSHTLVPVMKKMQEVAPSFDSPIVVHCSAGVGRTGTILLSDICLRMAKQKGVINMVHTLSRLREQRPNMVDNDEQYKLAHLLVLDCLVGLSTDIKCDEYLNNFENRLLNNSEHKKEILYLEENKWRDEAMKSVATVSKNFMNYPEKNRIPTLVPEIQGRVCLSKYPIHDESSSYINAVRVQGYRSPEKFIVTQQPMPNTLGDFWRLIVEKRIEIIVSLNEIDFSNQSSCRFWPDEEEPKMHPVDFISVIFDDVVDCTYCNIYSVRVSYKENEQEDDLYVKIYSLKNWEAGIYLPPNCEEFLSFLSQIHSISRESRHIIITCLDGVTASGIYVALSFIIERMKKEEVCDICLSVRTIRHNREQFIVNDIQYGFLYSAALSWLKQHKMSST